MLSEHSIEKKENTLPVRFGVTVPTNGTNTPKIIFKHLFKKSYDMNDIFS